MDATAKLLAIIAVAAFATERILAVINYLIDGAKLLSDKSETAARSRATEARRLLLFAIAAVIGYVIVDRANLRLLHVLQVDGAPPLVDLWLTWLVVVAGADRAHAMLGGGEGDKNASGDDSDTPIVRVQIDGGEVRDLHRVR